MKAAPMPTRWVERFLVAFIATAGGTAIVLTYAVTFADGPTLGLVMAALLGHGLWRAITLVLFFLGRVGL